MVIHSSAVDKNFHGKTFKVIGKQQKFTDCWGKLNDQFNLFLSDIYPSHVHTIFFTLYFINNCCPKSLTTAAASSTQWSAAY